MSDRHQSFGHFLLFMPPGASGLADRKGEFAGCEGEKPREELARQAIELI